MTQTVDAYVSIGSTYTYLAVNRLPALARAHGVTVRWRPIDIRRIFAEAGYTPFADKPNKLKYMWRDIERHAARDGIAWNGPPPYPIRELEKANRIAVVAEAEDWVEPYFVAAYGGWFLHRELPGEAANIRRCCTAANQDPERVSRAADEPAIHDALAKQTREASIRLDAN